MKIVKEGSSNFQTVTRVTDNTTQWGLCNDNSRLTIRTDLTNNKYAYYVYYVL